MNESTPQKPSTNSVKPQAEFTEVVDRGMPCCVKECVCWASPGSFTGTFQRLSMHGGLSLPYKEDTGFFPSGSG